MSDTVYTWEEVAKHKNKTTGVWIVVHNEVYDVTKFMDDVSGNWRAFRRVMFVRSYCYFLL